MLLDFQGLHIARHPSFLRDVGEYQSHCKKQKKRQLVCNFEVFCGSALFLRSLPPCPNKIGLKVLKLNAVFNWGGSHFKGDLSLLGVTPLNNHYRGLLIRG